MTSIPNSISSHYQIRPQQCQLLAGGDINDVYCIELNTNEKGVLKINDADEFPKMFEAEAEGLELLKQSGSFRIPKVRSVVQLDTYQILELEYLATGIPNDDFSEVFGSQLAILHQNQKENFGGVNDNYIGSLPQSNQSHPTWTDFFISERLIPLIKRAFDQRLIDTTERKQTESFFAYVDQLWPKEKASLIHGDLWSGNYMILSNGQPALIDPAVYFGHREMDIGMMHLFGGFDPDIFESYQNLYPLESGWQKRIPYNQVYPLLVHLCLFGRGYWSRIDEIIDEFY